MKIWRLTAAALLTVSSCTSAFAQQTKAQMNTYNNSVIVTNGVGAITAANLHPLTQNIINSMCTIADATNCPITSLSGATTAGAPLIGAPGGGGGVAQGTRSGTTTVFPVIDGTSVNGQCAVFDAAGGFTSQACPGGGTGSGTVSSGLQGQGAAYAANGTTVVGIPECFPIETFGGGTGASGSANSSAYTAAVAAFGSNGGCISFSSGTYTFSSSPTITYPVGTYSVTIAGVGIDLTILNFPTGNGPLFIMGTNCQTPNTCSPSVHVRDMSITTGAAPSGNICLNTTFLANQLTFPPWSDITNVTCRADVIGSRTHGWAFGINFRGVSNVNIDGVSVMGMPTPSSGPITGGSGQGLTIAGDVPIASAAVIFNIHDSNFVGNLVGVQYGDYVQGVAISNTNINFNSLGLETVTGAVGVLSQLSVVNSSFNNYNNNVILQSHLEAVQFSNNLVLLFANSAGIICADCYESAFTGNTIVGNGFTGTVGMQFQNGATHDTVVGNVFNSLTSAINVLSGVSGINIQSNSYSANTNNVVNNGSISAGSCAGIGGTCAAGATP